MHKVPLFASIFTIVAFTDVRPDTTIVEKFGQYEVPIKLKGNLLRVKDPTGGDTTIMDIRNKDSIILMPSAGGENRFIRVPGRVLDPFPSPSPLPKPSPTGKKETINGFATEEYVRNTPNFTAIFSVAVNYPNYESILKAMIVSYLGGGSEVMRTACPDYRDLPGVPIRVQFRSSSSGSESVMSVTALNEAVLPDSDFQPPPDYKEIKPGLPDLSRVKIPVPPLFPTPTPSPKTPH